MPNCIICNKYFISKVHPGRPSKTCSIECSHKLKIKQIIEWNKNNPDKFKETQKRYKIKYPDRILKSSINWQKRNQEKKREWNKKSLKNFLKKNPDYFKENIKKDYLKHKDRWISRKKTLYLIKNGSIILDNYCQSCKNKKNLQIHHEIYPETSELIILAVKEHKIYNLCKNCHEFLHSYKVRLLA